MDDLLLRLKKLFLFPEYIYYRDYNLSVLEHHNLECIENIQMLFELLKLADM